MSVGVQRVNAAKVTELIGGFSVGRIARVVAKRDVPVLQPLNRSPKRRFGDTKCNVMGITDWCLEVRECALTNVQN
jgi:hypothetical protein